MRLLQPRIEFPRVDAMPYTAADQNGVKEKINNGFQVVSILRSKNVSLKCALTSILYTLK